MHIFLHFMSHQVEQFTPAYFLSIYRVGEKKWFSLYQSRFLAKIPTVIKKKISRKKTSI